MRKTTDYSKTKLKNNINLIIAGSDEKNLLAYVNSTNESCQDTVAKM